MVGAGHSFLSHSATNQNASLTFSLIKEEINRPKYSKLLQHSFILRGEKSHTDVATYVSDILETMSFLGITPFTTDQPAECWFD